MVRTPRFPFTVLPLPWFNRLDFSSEERVIKILGPLSSPSKLAQTLEESSPLLSVLPPFLRFLSAKWPRSTLFWCLPLDLPRPREPLFSLPTTRLSSSPIRRSARFNSASRSSSCALRSSHYWRQDEEREGEGEREERVGESEDRCGYQGLSEIEDNWPDCSHRLSLEDFKMSSSSISVPIDFHQADCFGSEKSMEVFFPPSSSSFFYLDNLAKIWDEGNVRCARAWTQHYTEWPRKKPGTAYFL